MDWLVFAVGSAVFAGSTALLAKCGVRRIDSDLATALRTGVVLLFSILMVYLTGAQAALSAVTGRTLLLLILSGLATGGSWLFYFRALQLGDIHKVVPIDKSSTVLTILLSWLCFGETVTLLRIFAVCVLTAGTLLMAVPRARESAAAPASSRGWLFCACMSALLASLTAILGKLGMADIPSNLGTAIRTAVVLVMAWGIAWARGAVRTIRLLDAKDALFLFLSGLTTGASWLCYYRALQTGPASVVVPIDKLSILITVGFSVLFLHERLSRRAAVGLLLITAGTLLLLV